MVSHHIEKYCERGMCFHISCHVEGAGKNVVCSVVYGVRISKEGAENDSPVSLRKPSRCVYY